jgi:hypothetical protein
MIVVCGIIPAVHKKRGENTGSNQIQKEGSPSETPEKEGIVNTQEMDE